MSAILCVLVSGNIPLKTGEIFAVIRQIGNAHLIDLAWKPANCRQMFTKFRILHEDLSDCNVNTKLLGLRAAYWVCCCTSKHCGGHTSQTFAGDNLARNIVYFLNRRNLVGLFRNFNSMNKFIFDSFFIQFHLVSLYIENNHLLYANYRWRIVFDKAT